MDELLEWSFQQVYDPTSQVDQEGHLGTVWQAFIRLLDLFPGRIQKAEGRVRPFIGRFEAFEITCWIGSREDEEDGNSRRNRYE